MSESDDGECRLCLQKTKLCWSHIIPEFLYSYLYDPRRHSFYELDTAAKKKRFRHKGYREKLLCESCEATLNRYEDYSSKVLTGVLPLPVLGESEHMVSFGGVDYTRFKLFTVSLIWRCSVSSLREFRGVEIGRHSEAMRKMLLSGDPGEPWTYGSLMGVPKDYEIAKQAMLTPERLRIGSHTAYRFVCLGYMWIVFVSSHTSSYDCGDVFLQPNGILSVIKANALTNVWEGIAAKMGLKRL